MRSYCAWALSAARRNWKTSCSLQLTDNSFRSALPLAAEIFSTPASTAVTSLARKRLDSRNNRERGDCLPVARRFHNCVIDRDKSRFSVRAKDRHRTLSRRFRSQLEKEHLRAKRRCVIQAPRHGESAHHYAR